MEIRQLQEQKQQQRLTFNQRQTMIARMLDAGMALQELVSREIDENPALEVEEDDLSDSPRDISLDELRKNEEAAPTSNTLDDNPDDWDSANYTQNIDQPARTDDWEPHRYDERTSTPDNDSFEQRNRAVASFYDDLNHQLDELVISDSDKEIAAYIIGNLENTGYLKRSPADLADDLLTTYGKRVAAAEIERVLVTIVQTLEPNGVGARNLPECLAIQLQAIQNQQDSYLVGCARRIIEENFDDFSKKQFAEIMRKEGLTSEEFQQVQKIIQHLAPYPGPGESTQYIIPDFLIEIEMGKLRLSLVNEYKPRLRVNKTYENWFNFYREKKNTAAANQYKELIDKANHFIEVFPEISKTLYQVMATIMVFQEDFFLTGDSKLLKPMILKDIAEKLSLDESTISRCTSQRYVQTPYGIFLLKNLFSEATNKEDGVAARALKQHIRELIDKEDKKCPLTDEHIVELLAQQGFQISRRTVAKYRDQLGISATSVRRQR